MEFPASRRDFEIFGPILVCLSEFRFVKTILSLSPIGNRDDSLITLNCSPDEQTRPGDYAGHDYGNRHAEDLPRFERHDRNSYLIWIPDAKEF